MRQPEALSGRHVIYLEIFVRTLLRGGCARSGRKQTPSSYVVNEVRRLRTRKRYLYTHIHARPSVYAGMNGSRIIHGICCTHYNIITRRVAILIITNKIYGRRWFIICEKQCSATNRSSIRDLYSNYTPNDWIHMFHVPLNGACVCKTIMNY